MFFHEIVIDGRDVDGRGRVTGWTRDRAGQCGEVRPGGRRSADRVADDRIDGAGGTLRDCE